MKPIKLTISGVKSFSEEVVIDFKELTKSGLFGIFGDTGSGKSTILESIVCALYSSKFKTDYISKRCNNAEIDFEFQLVSSGVRKVYKVNRKYSLKSTSKSVLYEVLDDKNKVVICEKQRLVDDKIIEIIGLNADEFESSIVLPQGKFDKFLTATRINRVKIMESLFGLEKYGEKLKKNTDELNANYKEQETVLNTKLAMFKDVTKESVEALKNEYLLAKKEYEITNENNNKILDYIEKNAVFYNYQNRLKEVKVSLENLSKKQAYFENAKSVISKLYSIKKIIELNDLILQNESSVSLINSQLISSKNLQIENENNKQIYSRKILLYKGEIETLTTKLSSLEINFEKAKIILKQNQSLKLDLNDNLLEIDKLNKQIQSKKQELKSLENDVVVFTQNLEKVSLDACLKNLESAISKKAVNSKIHDEQNFLNELLAVVSEQKPKIKISSRLEFLLNALSQEGEFKDEFTLINEVKTAFDKQVEIQNKLSEISLNKQAVVSLIEIISAKILECQNTNAEITQKIKRNDEEILTLNGGQDLEESIFLTKKALEENKRLLQNGETKLKEVETSILNATLKIKELELKLESLNSKKGELLNELETIKKEVAYTLEESKKIVAEYGSETLQKDTENYFNEVLLLNGEQRNIEKILKNSQFDLSVYTENLNKKQEIHEKLLLQAEKTAKIKNSCEKIEQNYKDKCIIEKEYNILYEKIKLLQSLIALIKERKFLEFIADEYLKEICLIARKTLFNLSSGKYGLEYDGEFFVTDNLNGGEKRGVVTLSGGETFIVSLSLALALSTEIHSASLRPIEFFFLDEGFGTLDKSLTEIVINCLQKLKTSNFTIGLISHVDELKDAVDGKIEVTSATHSSGSKVKVVV